MNYPAHTPTSLDSEVSEMVQFFKLDEKNVVVEFHTPRTQLIVVERIHPWRFRIHINVQEKRIVAVRQIEPGAPPAPPEALDKYKAFMK